MPRQFNIGRIKHIHISRISFRVKCYNLNKTDVNSNKKTTFITLTRISKSYPRALDFVTRNDLYVIIQHIHILQKL